LPDEAASAIAKLKERHNEDGSISIKVELHDKVGALDRLGKSIGLFKEADVNHRHKHEHELVDPMARIMERLAALKKARAELLDVEIDPPPRRIAPRRRNERRRYLTSKKKPAGALALRTRASFTPTRSPRTSAVTCWG
jgi:hypothetical protein